MTVTRDEVLAAVEKFLPRTANYARSSDLGEVNRADVFKRLVQIILTSLLVDKGTIFYIVYLSSQRLLDSINRTIETLESLESTELLKGVTDVAPTRIEDLTQLVDAQESLLGLSGALLSGEFGTNHFQGFTENITGFLEDQVVPNVRSGNTVALSNSIRAAMEVLKAEWAEVLERREAVFSIVDKYQDKDLKILVSADIISAIQLRLREIEAELPTLTTNEQAQAAKDLMIDLAAAQAALTIVANAESPFGTVITGPAANGFTEATYLVLEGQGKVEPVAPIMRGDDGRIQFDTTLVSETGQTDSETVLSDPGVADFSLVVTIGQYLTFAETGEWHTVTAVSSGTISITPGTAFLLATPQKYVVTDTAPGRLFTSRNDFWDEFEDGETGSSVLLSGTDGAWLREDKASGVDGTNIKTSGLNGSTFPQKTTGTTDFVMGAFDLTDPGKTFIDDSIIPGDVAVLLSGGNIAGNPWTISYLTAQDSLVVTPGWLASDTGVPYILYPYQFDRYFTDVGADFLSNGVVPFDVIEIDTVGSITVGEVHSETEIKCLGVFGSAMTGLDWKIRYQPGIWRMFVDPNATFLSDGVEAGDILDLGIDGTYIVAAVQSQTSLTTTLNLPNELVSVSWAVYVSATDTSTFQAQDVGVDFEDSTSSNPLFPDNYHVGPTVEITEYYPGAVTVRREVTLTVDGVDYAIVSLDPDQEFDVLDPDVTNIIVDDVVTVDPGPFDWSIRVTDFTRDFYDTTNSPFSDYAVDDILVYKPGTDDEVRVPIIEIVSSSHVRLGGEVPQGETEVNYAVISRIRPGLQIVFAGLRYNIVDVVSKHVLLLDQAISLAIGKDIEFFIVKKGNTPLSYRLVDIDTATGIGPFGFPSSVIGSDFEFMTGKPVKAKVMGVADPDQDGLSEALAVNASMRIGERHVRYRLRVLIENVTKQFLAPESSILTAEEGDLLTAWDISGVYTVQSVSSDSPNYIATIEPAIVARLVDQSFIIVREGAPDHGRYLLFDDMNSGVTVDADTAALRLKVAEILTDFGSALTAVSNGTLGDVTVDPDGDGETDVFIDSGTDFVGDGVQFGDRLSVLYGSDIETTYVTEVMSATELRVDPPLPVAVSTHTWSLDRNSVTNSLVEVARLKAQMVALQDVVDSYLIDRNITVQSVLDLLKKQHMDRAIDLLYDGKFDEFAELTKDASSYSSAARAAIQTVGGSVVQSPELDENVAGIDPATGKVSSSDNFALTPSASSTNEEVETVIALSRGVVDLLADERARSMLQFSIEEARNLGIYELTGEIESGVVSDEDATLPWIAKTGSTKTKVESRTKAVTDALQYMLDHPDEFTEPEAE